MSDLLTTELAESHGRNPLTTYTLADEKPNWSLAFEANPWLYGRKGLSEFIDYLDDTLSQPTIGPATREKYQAKRDEVNAVLVSKFDSDEA
jgi:hypothetical protein